jgi:ATP-binding cassette subfamily F protein 3
MLMQPSNFLLLDEPTNHLDMRAKDVLLTSLQEYSGTVVFVSHDRYFIDKLATRVFEVEDGKVNVFPGNYEDYQWRKSGQGALAVSGPLSAGSEPEASAKNEKRVNPMKVRKLKERLGSIEAEVGQLEAGIADCESALANFVSAEETRRVTELLESRRAELTALMGEWEEISQSVDHS